MGVWNTVVGSGGDVARSCFGLVGVELDRDCCALISALVDLDYGRENSNTMTVLYRMTSIVLLDIRILHVRQDIHRYMRHGLYHPKALKICDLVHSGAERDHVIGLRDASVLFAPLLRAVSHRA